MYFKEEFPVPSRLDCSPTKKRMPIRRKFSLQNLEDIRDFSLNTEYLAPYAKTNLVIHQVILDYMQLSLF